MGVAGATFGLGVVQMAAAERAAPSMVEACWRVRGIAVGGGESWWGDLDGRIEATGRGFVLTDPSRRHDVDFRDDGTVRVVSRGIGPDGVAPAEGPRVVHTYAPSTAPGSVAFLGGTLESRWRSLTSLESAVAAERSNAPVAAPSP